MTTKTFTNTGWVCIDCVDIIANGWSNFNDRYPEDYSEGWARREDIKKGLSEGIWTYIGDENLDATFSSAQCACCRSLFAGSRHLVQVEIAREVSDHIAYGLEGAGLLRSRVIREVEVEHDDDQTKRIAEGVRDWIENPGAYSYSEIEAIFEDRDPCEFL